MMEDSLFGEFELCGIPPAPRGVPHMKITFEVNGVVLKKVGVMDKEKCVY